VENIVCVKLIEERAILSELGLSIESGYLMKRYGGAKKDGTRINQIRYKAIGFR